MCPYIIIGHLSRLQDCTSSLSLMLIPWNKKKAPVAATTAVFATESTRVFYTLKLERGFWASVGEILSTLFIWPLQKEKIEFRRLVPITCTWLSDDVQNEERLM